MNKQELEALYPIPDYYPPIVRMELERRRAWLDNEPEADRAKRWKSIIKDVEDGPNDVAGIAIPSAYRDASPEGARDREAFDKVLNHPRDSDYKGKRGLILFGDTGSGKTSAAYARVLLNMIDHCTFSHISAVHLARMVRESPRNPSDFAMMMRLLTCTDTDDDTDNGDQEFVGRWQSCWGLLIDDIGIPRLTPAYAAALYDIIEGQTAARNELIVTCQTDGAGLLANWRAEAPELADIAKAIVRRIVDHCEPIHFVWEDSSWE